MEYSSTPSGHSQHPGIRHDLFKAIPYVYGSHLHAKVPGLQFEHVFVPKWAMGMVWTRCCASVSLFSTYRFYTTEELFNDAPKWGAYESGTHRIFGRCVRYLELNGMLPIACINPGMNRSKLYQIRQFIHTAATDDANGGRFLFGESSGNQ